MAYDPLSEIEALRTQQKQKAYSDLEAQKNNSLSQLNQEKSQIQPQYYKSRNTASTNSQLQAKNFAEYMANRGLASSGTAAQAELTRNVGLQGQIGALNQQENAAYSDIARRNTDVNNNFNTGLTSAYAGIDSDINSQIINYRNQLAQEERQREYERQQAELEYQRQLALKRASSSGGGSSKKSSSSSARTSSQGNNTTTLAWEELQRQFSAGTASLWLDQYKDSLKDTVGTTEYNKMVKTYQDLFNQKYTAQQDYRKSDKQRQLMEGQ